MSDSVPVALSLEPPSWMTDPATSRVMAALDPDKKGARARFVGGCVRNHLLGHAVGDIDIATVLTPEDSTRALEAAGLKVVPTGIDHGTVTAVCEGRGFEVTTLRRDVATDGRRAVVEFTDDWREDAQRRDFTLNTLLADVKGAVYDPTGQGLVDLRAGRVVFVGDADARIREDYLRILRFFRFHGRYGKGAPDGVALAACTRHAASISGLSQERTTREFFAILSMDHPTENLKLMFKNKILNDFVNQKYDENVLKYLCKMQNSFDLRTIASRLFVLAGLEKNGIDNLKKYLLIPKVFLRDIELISQVILLPDLARDQTVREAVYRYGRTATAQGLLVAAAQDRVTEQVMERDLTRLLRIAQGLAVPDFPIDGKDVAAAGIAPGPELGRVLKEVEDWWIAGDFTADRAACLAQIKALLQL